MGSSKKKGQQRKAAKKALSAAAEGSSSGGVGSGGGGGGDYSSKIVAKVRSGDNKATKKLVPASSVGNISLRDEFSYEHSGVLSVVLEFLNRCEDETFDQVMSSVGGDLKSPTSWIHIISMGSLHEPSCKLQIAQSIGPLVRCMVNDTERLFFKNNKHWRQGIAVFVYLVLNLNVIELREKQLGSMKIVEALLNHEGLLIIQMGFLREYRPDIVKELRYETITKGSMGCIMGLSRTSWEIMGLLALMIIWKTKAESGY